MLSISKITCENTVNPLGIDIKKPRFCWQLESELRNTKQIAYHMQVSLKNPNFQNDLVWDTGRIESDQSIYIEYNGISLLSRCKYYYRIKVWDNHNQMSEWSEIQNWEMGILDPNEWKANWITYPFKEQKKAHKPCYYFRKEFILTRPITKARIYTSSLGLYELYLNEKRIGDELFTPGFTEYRHHIQYQTYDVTNSISCNKNVIGIILGEGWYRGRYQISGRNRWGSIGAVYAQLHIEFDDGSEEIIVSDESWTVATGPIQWSDLYDGEIYDARMEMNWLSLDFDDKGWGKTKNYMKFPVNRFIAPLGEKVCRIEKIMPREIIHTPKGEIVVDLGQNMVGWLQLRIHGTAGQKIIIDHGEILDNEGNFYRENLRSARAQIIYTCKGDELEIFEPHFTFFGFRYARITNWDQMNLDSLIGIVIHSNLQPIGSFKCSNAMLNQLQHNILWGEKGNFLDIPTDCPQRDERLGWTGDAQVFARTAMFNMDSARFYTKWLNDIRCSHMFNGSIPLWIPSTFRLPLNSSGWGDVATILPWTMYLIYGDRRILAIQYESMKKWFNYERKGAKRSILRYLFKSKTIREREMHIWQSGFHFGDWLAPGEIRKQWVAKKKWIATAYYAYSAQIIAKTAEILGKRSESELYWRLFHQIQHAFVDKFVEADGKITDGFQTAYILALEFNLLPEEIKKQSVNYLVKDIQDHDFHLTTGFLGTPLLCFALSNNKQLNIAYKLLLQTECPSWLYPITKGATTIWERWDGIQPDGSVNLSHIGGGNMVSFNHYAYGAVGDWLYRVVGGLEIDEKEPGYKRSIIRPLPGGNIEYAHVEFHSRYGEIQSKWTRSQNKIHLEVEIPPNTSSHIILMDAELSTTIASGIPITQVEDIINLKETEKNVEFEIGSGKYEFDWDIQ